MNKLTYKVPTLWYTYRTEPQLPASQSNSCYQQQHLMFTPVPSQSCSLIGCSSSPGALPPPPLPVFPSVLPLHPHRLSDTGKNKKLIFVFRLSKRTHKNTWLFFIFTKCKYICFLYALKRAGVCVWEGGGGGNAWSSVAMHPFHVTGLSMVCCYEKNIG